MSIIPQTETSPFDSIRRLRPDGSEYWSARELMPFLGYSRWQNFERVLDLAVTAAAVVGVDVDGNFTASSKKAGQRGPSGGDWELSRYGAYLVAMRGDSHKPEIAAALTYFATKTREAETGAGRAAELELARRVIELQEEVLRLREANTLFKQHIIDITPKAEGYDDLIASEGLFDLDAAAKVLVPVTGHAGPKRFRNLLQGMEVLYQGSDLPRQEYIKRGYFAVRTDVEGGKARPVTVLTAKGLRWLQTELREERPTLRPSVGHSRLGPGRWRG